MEHPDYHVHYQWNIAHSHPHTHTSDTLARHTAGTRHIHHANRQDAVDMKVTAYHHRKSIARVMMTSADECIANHWTIDEWIIQLQKVLPDGPVGLGWDGDGWKPAIATLYAYVMGDTNAGD